MTENDLKKMIYRLSDLTPTEKLTLLVALSFVDWVSWEGTASINQFADALATQRRAISRALKGLASKGYIERSSRRLGRQMNTRSDMKLNIDRIRGGDKQVHKGGDKQVQRGGDIKSLGGDRQVQRGGDIVSLGGDKQVHKGGDIVSLGGDIKSPLYIQPNNQPSNQPSNQPINQPNNQPTRAELPVALRDRCYKPERYMPPDLHDEKKKRMHTLQEAFTRCGLGQEYKIRWIRWWQNWRVDNYPLWHHIDWVQYDIDVIPAIEEIKREQEEAKKVRHPNQW